jgi:hypothetical protein
MADDKVSCEQLPNGQTRATRYYGNLEPGVVEDKAVAVGNAEQFIGIETVTDSKGISTIPFDGSYQGAISTGPTAGIAASDLKACEEKSLTSKLSKPMTGPALTLTS